MGTLGRKEKRILEGMLIVVIIGIAALYIQLSGHKIVVLNLFYLPIVVCGYFLGRFNAGVLALLSGLTVAIATSLDATGFAEQSDPVMVGLVLTIWVAALGLTAILVGTLCDERAATLQDLQKAYVGVVEVLSKYLQSANPRLKAQSERVAELSQYVAEQMKLAPNQINDVRVAALLHDLGCIEITTQVVQRALDKLQSSSASLGSYTFQGTDLAHSLGSVLESALPLVLGQDDALREYLADEDSGNRSDTPIGAEIIRAVRAYDAITFDSNGKPARNPTEAIQELRRSIPELYSEGVVGALAAVVTQSRNRQALRPALAH